MAQGSKLLVVNKSIDPQGSECSVLVLFLWCTCVSIHVLCVVLIGCQSQEECCAQLGVTHCVCGPASLLVHCPVLTRHIVCKQRLS
jgi:hypothetical protein